jgi:RES domain-containing protein
MTPLPAPLGGGELVAWRLDRDIYRATWDRGEGAFKSGGRWNNEGVRAVYCAIDPGVAILEVAVHLGFKVLDTVPYVLTEIAISEPQNVHVVHPESISNPAWLQPGMPSAGQKDFGDGLLAHHKFTLIPSTVSKHSWNLIFVSSVAAGAYALKSQERFALAAEADLKKSLELFPDQPHVLNYLGYSWIDQGVNLDEGMRMIKRAVEQRADDGYIVDSLGWAYYRLGNMDEAVKHLERAIELKPEDPTINGHLGDAYWRVGRELERGSSGRMRVTSSPSPRISSRSNRS